ncbi:hypothetical protein A2U01_0041525 [Trifolium medium]|uniref:Uncharacterized protein n=1 Tax=Trifolium medium TaxID=97028 RepID=A0A392Q7I9_9FABA|nr:hypothetical protein [Trifolium medium]
MSGARSGPGRPGRHVEKEVWPEIDPGARNGNMKFTPLIRKKDRRHVGRFIEVELF